MIEYKVNYDVNRRGVQTMNGQTMPTPLDVLPTEDDDPIILDEDVREIERETEELRALGKLAPFVEGTPIGKCINRRPPKKATRRQCIEYFNQSKEWARSEMLSLRRSNDRAIKEILR